MTATISTVGERPERTAIGRIRRLALALGSVLAPIGSRWNDLVDAGQLGASDRTLISRHTGARI